MGGREVKTAKQPDSLFSYRLLNVRADLRFRSSL